MIGEDVIKEAFGLALEAENEGGLSAFSFRRLLQLVRMLALACEAENGRRELLASAGLPATEPSGEEAATLAWLASAIAAGPPRAVLQACRFEFRHLADHIKRLEGRCSALEAMLSDAEDSLRAHASGRRAGLLEAADVCQERLGESQGAHMAGFLAGLRDTFRTMALPAASQSVQQEG